MCGIVGIINKKGKAVEKSELVSALHAIRHRGPDGEGFFIDQFLGIANCRLSIIDPHPRANQPLKYLEYVISFNGAVYNYQELRIQLEDLGHHFHTQSDTEVVLAAYAEWGEACVSRFNGMWAFVIYDPIKQQLFCSRDRYGIKPFYYYNDGRLFCFASEIKALAKIIPAKINTKYAYRFLAYGEQDAAEETLFENIYHLKAGHNLVYNIRTHFFEQYQYYQYPTNQNNDITDTEAIDGFRNLFYDAIRLRFRADVSLGSCLSGGLDSSSIVSGVHFLDLDDDHFKALSVFYDYPSCDEREYINAVLTKTGFAGIQISPSLDVLFDNLETIIYHQDEPIPSASVAAQYALFKRATTENLKVMLDGQGGDEVLAGYDIFYYTFLRKLFYSSPFKFFKEGLYFMAHYQSSLSLAIHNYQRFRKKSLNRPITWLAKVEPPEGGGLIPDDSLSETTQRLLTGMGVQALLHYEDRNSMAHSVESRLPFLDYRLVEFCLSLPDHLKIRKGLRKYLLREAMKGPLPEKIRTRKDKMGFEVPQREWMHENRDKLDKILAESIGSNPLISQKHFPKKPDYNLIWRVISFQKWVEVFNPKYE